jgi:hypothetical protein
MVLVHQKARIPSRGIGRDGFLEIGLGFRSRLEQIFHLCGRKADLLRNVKRLAQQRLTLQLGGGCGRTKPKRTHHDQDSYVLHLFPRNGR